MKTNNIYKAFPIHVELNFCERLKAAEKLKKNKQKTDVLGYFFIDLLDKGFGKCPYRVCIYITILFEFFYNFFFFSFID